MRRRSLAPLVAVCAVLVCLLATARASAMTIVPMTDEDLAVSSRAIVEGRVVDAEPVWNHDRGAVFTYVTVDVERVYKGDVPPGLLVLRQLGGRTGRHATEIDGSPELTAGERVLLFLNTDDEGAVHIAHLSLGHYEIVFDPVSGRDVAARNVDAATLTAVEPRGPVTDLAPLDDLVASIESTLVAKSETVRQYELSAEGTPLLIAPPEYTLRGAQSGEAAPAFTFLQPGFRWFEPDSGHSIAIKVNSRGGPTPSQGVDESKRAFAAWSSISRCSLEVVYAGKTSGGGHRADGVSAIAFGDPLHEIDDPVNCSGVVASGGVSSTLPEQMTISGKLFHRIAEADVVVNNGFECLLSDSVILSEVLTHEFGHSLGFGHSSERGNETNSKLRDATMYFVIHNDGRGASLREDDTDAARFLYPAKSSTLPLSLETTALPDARPGARYDVDLKARGGEAPYVWSLASGSLPTGLSLSQDGRITGTPTGQGASTFVVRLRDGNQSVDTQTLSIRVTQSPAPYVAKASFKPGKNRLVIAGLYFEAGAEITVNGQRVTTEVKYKASKGRLVASGSASRLNVDLSRSNLVVVTVSGQRSNTFSF